MSGTVTIKYCDIEKVEIERMINAANSGMYQHTSVCDAIFTGAGATAMLTQVEK